jgi:multiple sugar transport system substrate-binding protein
MKRFFLQRAARLAAIALMTSAATLTLAACGGTSDYQNGKKVLTVAYGSDFVFITPDLATKWWNTVAHEFEAQHPDVIVKFTPIPGGYTDIVTKLNLLYRSPSTAPALAELPSGQFGSWVASDYLLPIDKYVATAPWWKNFPASVQQETSFNGHVYGVNHGENTNAIYYNMPMFRKAGLPVPWQPKTWNDIIAAGERIHATQPKVWPVWLQGGTAGGTISIQYNSGNLLLGSSNPTIFDEKTQKWVVDSSGLRETFDFYSQLAKHGLQAPLSQLLDPNATVNSFQLMSENKIGIAISGNFLGTAWVPQVCGPCWPAGPKTYAVAHMPTVNGTGSPNIASSLGGWELAIGKTAPFPNLAWDFIQVAQQRQNMIDASNWAGWVPPDRQYWSDPLFANFAPPYQTFFANVMPHAEDQPNSADFTVWGTGFNLATGAIIQNPSTSVQDAVNIMKSYVDSQLISGDLGSKHTETQQ